MNTAAAAPAQAGEQSQPFGARRVLLLVFGSIVLLLALALLAGGGAAAWGLSQRDASGYLTTGTHELSTASYALASESLDVGPDIPGWLDGRFATIQVEASSPRPVFIGIARVRDVERYLADVQHAQITEFATDPFSVSYGARDGTAKPAPPASQDFWRIQASGSGAKRSAGPSRKASGRSWR